MAKSPLDIEPGQRPIRRERSTGWPHWMILGGIPIIVLLLVWAYWTYLY